MLLSVREDYEEAREMDVLECINVELLVDGTRTSSDTLLKFICPTPLHPGAPNHQI